METFESEKVSQISAHTDTTAANQRPQFLLKVVVPFDRFFTF